MIKSCDGGVKNIAEDRGVWLLSSSSSFSSTLELFANSAKSFISRNGTLEFKIQPDEDVWHNSLESRKTDILTRLATHHELTFDFDEDYLKGMTKTYFKDHDLDIIIYFREHLVILCDEDFEKYIPYIFKLRVAEICVGFNCVDDRENCTCIRGSKCCHKCQEAEFL
eukprot:Awhi_evm1s5071